MADSSVIPDARADGKPAFFISVSYRTDIYQFRMPGVEDGSDCFFDIAWKSQSP